MADVPDDQPQWMQIADPDELHEVPLYLAGDPYFPHDDLVAPVDFLEEEHPSEDEEEDDPEEDEESDDEGIPHDAQEIEDDGPIKEGLTDEEPAPPTPPSSPTRSNCQPYLLCSKGPHLMRTPGMSAAPL